VRKDRDLQAFWKKKQKGEESKLEIFSYLMAETKDCEMSQICIVSVKFLKDVRDFDRNAANWQ
jgi:ribosome-binding factor A